jgi:hypothetical protein
MSPQSRLYFVLPESPPSEHKSHLFRIAPTAHFSNLSDTDYFIRVTLTLQVRKAIPHVFSLHIFRLNFCAFFVFQVRATCYFCLVIVDLITLYDEGYLPVVMLLFMYFVTPSIISSAFSPQLIFFPFLGRFRKHS